MDKVSLTKIYLAPAFSMFELATQDEIDKLRTNEAGSDKKSSEELQLEDLEVKDQ